MAYTLIDFGNEFRILLLKADKAGFETDDIGGVAEAVLESDWSKPVTQDMIPGPIGE